VIEKIGSKLIYEKAVLAQRARDAARKAKDEGIENSIYDSYAITHLSI